MRVGSTDNDIVQGVAIPKALLQTLNHFQGDVVIYAAQIGADEHQSLVRVVSLRDDKGT